MSSQKPRPGVAEYCVIIGFVLMGGLAAWGVQTGWPIVMAPALTYVVASGAAYALYRHGQGEQPPSADVSPTVTLAETSSDAPLPRVAGAVSFRVVEARGVCPLGRRVGEIVSVSRGGKVSLPVCPHAEATLRLAAAHDGNGEIKEWCCPIYDHFLVFRKEKAQHGGFVSVS